MNDQGNRIENDFLGKKSLPADALYGIHSVRAKENFPDNNTFHIEWYSALGKVKKACYLTAKEFYTKVSEKTAIEELPLKIINSEILDALISASEEVIDGQHFDSFIVPAISGGAGTSINLNINEIITNRALQLLGNKPGDYQKIDPIEEANIFQSTNDVVPTSLKVAGLQLLVTLEESVNNLRFDIEQLEKKHSNHLRKGYTQLQEAVPTSFGKLFSTYSDALSRDWWRVSKCFERIKVVNLGGSAIGSGITVPRFFIMEVTNKLKELSGTPVTRSENLYDTTNNLDAFVEIHGILKAHAVNLEKMVNDLRILSSDLTTNKSLEIPQKQVGSSIMPGKVNPVIAEFVISCSHRIYSNDVLISSLCGQGHLELNAYIPLIGHALLESLKILIACNQTIKNNLIDGLKVYAAEAESSLQMSPSIATALVPYLGYNKAAELARHMKANHTSVYASNKSLKLIGETELRDLLSPQRLLQSGFTLSDIINKQHSGKKGDKS
jgi:aspartate ammonia-lyase